MKKDIISKALYCRVKLTDFTNDIFYGWLIPYYNKYMILPFNNGTKVIFNATSIKYIMHLSNCYILK